MDDDPDRKYEMLYCDSARCRVNTFEHGISGECPGCGVQGIPLR